MLRRCSNPNKALEKAIGYRFRTSELLITALTHRSFRYEAHGVEFDNQRLEFLGDAVLGFVAGAYLFDRHVEKAEGHLTTMRSRITSGRALARIASSILLGDYIMVGRGEERSGGRARTSNLADALESVIGAAYLDRGVKAVEKIFKKLFVPLLEECGEDVWGDNPKGRLQEWSQRHHKKSPVYRVTRQRGPSHAREYTIEVLINGEPMGTGAGRNKRVAEANAAEKALTGLGDNL